MKSSLVTRFSRHMADSFAAHSCTRSIADYVRRCFVYVCRMEAYSGIIKGDGEADS
jgi:hypothetical protein